MCIRDRDEAIKGCAAWLSTTRGASEDLFNGESQGETNEQAAGARVRLGRAAAAKVASLSSIIFSSTMCRQRLVRGLQWSHSLLSRFSSCEPLYLLKEAEYSFLPGQEYTYILYYTLHACNVYIYICIESWDVPSFKGCTAYTAVLFLAVALRSGGGHDDGGGGRRRGGDTLWCNTCSGAEAPHYQRRRPRPAGVTHQRHGRDLDLCIMCSTSNNINVIINLKLYFTT